jgi:hypothetical protein
MSVPGTVQIQVIAFFVACFVAYFIHRPIEWMCGSPIGASFVALGIGFGVFMLICFKWRGSTVDSLHPPAGLYQLTTIKALAAIKNALLIKYFDDKHWHFETLEPEEGTAFFVCKYQDRKNDKEPPKDRTILLHVKVNRVSNAASVQLDYELVSINSLEQDKPGEFCTQTTEHIEQQLQAAVEKAAV